MLKLPTNTEFHLYFIYLSKKLHILKLLSLRKEIKNTQSELAIFRWNLPTGYSIEYLDYIHLRKRTFGRNPNENKPKRLNSNFVALDSRPNILKLCAVRAEYFISIKKSWRDRSWTILFLDFSVWNYRFIRDITEIIQEKDWMIHFRKTVR